MGDIAWFVAAFATAKTLFADGFGWGHLASTIKVGMEAVERVSGLSGEEKKAQVCAFIDYVLDNTDTPWLPDAVSDPVMKGLARQFVPGLIDTLVAATKGEVAVNRKAA